MHFNWEINVGTVCSILMLLATTVNYGKKVVNHLQGISFRVSIMWAEFEKEHPDLAKQAAGRFIYVPSRRSERFDVADG